MNRESEPSSSLTSEASARLLSSRASFAFALGMLMLALLAGALLFAGSRPPLVPYWYALVPLQPTLFALLPGILALIVYALVGYTLRQGPPLVVASWAFAGALALPVVFLTVYGHPVEQLLMRTISSQATGGFSKGVEVSGDLLRRWPELMAEWRTAYPHIAISLPGWPLVYGGLVSVFERVPTVAGALAGPLRSLQCHQWGFNTLSDAQIAAGWLGVASPLWSALTVLPLYAFARRVAGAQAAAGSVLLWPLVPAASLFMGTLNSPYPLLAVTVALATWLAVLEKRSFARAALMILAGALSGVLIVLNLALVPLLLLCGLLALFAPWTVTTLSARARLARSVVSGIWFGVGLAGVAGVYWVLAGHSPLQVIGIALGVHFDMQRAYLSGVGLHLWDFVLFTGLPLLGLALLGGFGGSRRPLSALAAFAAALGLTLIVLLISGTAQGEVGRVWLFFMPFVTLLAAVGLARLTAGGAALALAAQGIWLTALVATVGPVDTWLSSRPDYGQVAYAPLPSPVIPASARFGDGLRLVGFQSEADPAARSLRVALHWSVEQGMDVPYYFSGVLVAPDGQVLPAVNWQPFEKRYPTTCWTEGQTSLVDVVTLPLGDGAPAGDWWLSLSAFLLGGSETPQFLPVTLPDGAQDGQLGIGPLPVP